MPRRLRSAQLETRSARLKLIPRGKPYWLRISSDGIALGYRAGPGTWSVRAADGAGSSWIKRLGLADDREDADGANVLTFWQAADKAKAVARGKDADTGRPPTVSEALDDYATDLSIRGGGKINASVPRFHLPPSLLAKPVAMLTVRELRHWRNGLAAKLKASSINRIAKALKAAFNLAAAHDDRITNAKAWKIGLAALPEAETESNIVLSDEQRRAIIASAYAIGDAFGIYIELHAVTGARSSQIAALDVRDLELGTAPRLLMPSSLKGRNRRTRTRKPVPIPIGLAQRLQAIVTGRAADQPLLMMTDGRRWSAGAHHKLFAAAAKAAKLPAGATAYSLRHSAVTYALLAGVPVRLVASSFDTSIAMIEKSYSKFISDHGDTLMRRALLDIDAPDGNVVVPMVRG